MEENQYIWRVWADRVHRWGLSNLTASILDGIGPLTLLGAQALYLAQPILSPLVPNNHINELANLLEEPEKVEAFAAYLREDASK